MTIRVLLADDHNIVRQALRDLLEKDPEISVVAEARDGEEALKLAQEIKPDVVIMDVGMPKTNGIEATQKLMALNPAIRIVALSAHGDKRFVMGMLDAGAVGYVVKTEAAEELLHAIHCVADGGVFLCPTITPVVTEMLQQRNGRHEKTLGPRERQVLELLAQGLSSPEIGNRLHIAPTTVEVHRRNIMRKLELRGIAALTRYAIKEGMVSL